MPFDIKTLAQLRRDSRDFLTAKLPGTELAPPNSRLRVLSDKNAATGHLVLLHQEWLSRMLLPDTSETEWLDRHGNIWLINADGSRGRKKATLAAGTVTFTGTAGTFVPFGTRLVGNEVEYETVEEVILGVGATECAIRAIDPGVVGNRAAGEGLSVSDAVDGLDSQATIVELVGGTDAESDANLLERVLQRIQQPPMGGAAHDYVAWALAVPGVSRAWCAPNEMGIGTVSLRIMCDFLRADNDGLPLPEDIQAVQDYLDLNRPVAVKDFFVLSPLVEPISFSIDNLDPDTSATRAAINAGVAKMLNGRARPSSSRNGVLVPAQTIFEAWVSEAASAAIGVESFDLIMSDHVMPSNGHMAFMGTVTYL